MGIKLNAFLIRIRKFLTPIKGSAIVLILLGILDNLTYIQHSQVENPLAETLVRSFFIFCGLFAVLGNGKTAKLRAFIVSIPYFYLAIFFLVTATFLGDKSLFVIGVPPALFGIWLIVAGSDYER